MDQSNIGYANPGNAGQTNLKVFDFDFSKNVEKYGLKSAKILDIDKIFESVQRSASRTDIAIKLVLTEPKQRATNQLLGFGSEFSTFMGDALGESLRNSSTKNHPIAGSLAGITGIFKEAFSHFNQEEASKKTYVLMEPCPSSILGKCK